MHVWHTSTHQHSRRRLIVPAFLLVQDVHRRPYLGVSPVFGGRNPHQPVSKPAKPVVCRPPISLAIVGIQPKEGRVVGIDTRDHLNEGRVPRTDEAGRKRDTRVGLLSAITHFAAVQKTYDEHDVALLGHRVGIDGRVHILPKRVRAPVELGVGEAEKPGE